MDQVRYYSKFIVNWDSRTYKKEGAVLDLALSTENEWLCHAVNSS